MYKKNLMLSVFNIVFQTPTYKNSQRNDRNAYRNKRNYRNRNTLATTASAI